MQLLAKNGGRKARGQSRKSAHAQFRGGIIRVANLRAVTAARFYLDKIASGEPVTLREAALSHGSNVPYVQAGVVIVKTKDPFLIADVLDGHLSILVAAKSVKQQIQAIEALKAASPASSWAIFANTGFTNNLGTLLACSSSEERTEAAHVFGHADMIWDEMVEPLLNPAE